MHGLELISGLVAYRLLVSAAFAVGFFLALIRLQRASYELIPTVEILAGGVWAAFLGGVALHWAVAKTYELLLPRSGEQVFGGITVIGGLIASLVTMIWLCWRRGIDHRPFLDIVCVTVPLCQAIGRLGCLCAGCCFGRVTSSPLAMQLPNLDGVIAPRFPTQIMSAVANLLIFSALLVVERLSTGRGCLRVYPGFVLHLFFALYCLKRSIIELLRDTAPPIIGPFTWVHFLTLPGFIVLLVVMIRRLRLTMS